MVLLCPPCVFAACEYCRVAWSMLVPCVPHGVREETALRGTGKLFMVEGNGRVVLAREDLQAQLHYEEHH